MKNLLNISTSVVRFGGRALRSGLRRSGTLLAVAAALLSTACDGDILDIAPQDRIAGDAVWTDEALITAYHTELYNAIPHGFYLHMYSKYTDEAYNSAPCCGADIFARNTYTPDNINQVAEGDFWGGHMYYWDMGYRYVRKINTFLDRMETGEIDFAARPRLVAEAKFLRAFIYFELIKRYGGVPIVAEVYELHDAQDITFRRNTFEEVVAFIEQDLDEAMVGLPDRYGSTDSNNGRASQDAAMALRSRVLLYAASPLHNPSNDRQRWQRAADAAEALFDRGYSLHPDYRQLFLLPTGAPQNEFIFTRNFTATNGHQVPMHTLSRRYGAYGGWWASNGPSQNLVDDYDMVSGEPAYLRNGGSRTVNPASDYDPADPYANRDPRFEASIIHDGTVYRGDLFEMWTSADGETWGFDSYKQSGDNPRTGYVLKKFMPDDDVPLNWQTQYTNPWPHFRLGEIYLNYAEAQFELGNEGVARQYVSMVRERAGMPALPSTLSGTALRDRIRNERRIELAFEGHRFFDIRRWLIAAEVENAPIRGMDIVLTAADDRVYTPVELLVKAPYEDKMNLLPIATDEIRRNPELTQTPGW